MTDRAFWHPWLRVEPLTRAILETRTRSPAHGPPRSRRLPKTFNDHYWSAVRDPRRSMTSRGHKPKQSPGLRYKRVVSCKDSFHGGDGLGRTGTRRSGTALEHPRARRRSSKGGRPQYIAGPRRGGNRSTLIADISFPSRKRRSQAVRERKTSVLRACRVPNPAKRLNVVQRSKTLFEPQRSMTSRS